MKRPRTGSEREPTIALINIVFLMLVFFMVAGTLARPLDTDLTLVETRDLDRREPPDALVIHVDGQLVFRGEDVASPSDYLARADESTEVRIVPDRALPAADLLAIAARLRAAGADRVLIVTEQALP